MARDTPLTKDWESHSQKYSNFTYVKKDDSLMNSLKNDEDTEILDNPYFNMHHKAT